MALLPTNNLTIGTDVTVTTQPSKTYTFDMANSRIRGTIDGTDAIKQAIYKILLTQRYSYLIYDWNIGIEIEELIGKDALYVESEIERRISEALTQDDRILSITNFTLGGISGSNYTVSFTVNTTEGQIQIEGVTV